MDLKTRVIFATFIIFTALFVYIILPLLENSEDVRTAEKFIEDRDKEEILKGTYKKPIIPKDMNPKPTEGLVNIRLTPFDPEIKEYRRVVCPKGFHYRPESAFTNSTCAFIGKQC